MVDLGTLGGAYGLVLGLNNTGQVIGVSSVAANPGACFFTEGDPNCHPFLWNHGKLIALSISTIGGSPITADEINDAGEIVGAADFSSVGGSPFGAYLLRNGVATNVGTVSGDCFSRTIAINASAQVVGNSFTCDASAPQPFKNAFLWENGSIIDLNDVIPASSSLHLVASNDINDRGEIAGEGVPPGVDPSNVNAEGHAFLLIPVCADGTDGCADAPLDPASFKGRVASGCTPPNR
jgi:probable HAF family extracellular repeat protein